MIFSFATIVSAALGSFIVTSSQTATAFPNQRTSNSYFRQQPLVFLAIRCMLESSKAIPKEVPDGDDHDPGEWTQSGG